MYMCMISHFALGVLPLRWKVSVVLSVVKLLLSKHTTDINACQRSNSPPENQALSDFCGQTDYEGKTILHSACLAGDVELAETLLMHYNANLLSVNIYGDTPLHTAAKSGKDEVVRLLVTEYNCPVDRRNNMNRTPFLCALRSGNLSVVGTFLSKHKADMNDGNDTPLNQIDDIINREGRTILHQACSGGYVDCLLYTSDAADE